jgi:hypothetical protein
MKKLLLLLCFTPLLLASTCENDNEEIICTQQFVHGLDVVVLDNTTGNPLVEDVQVSAEDGTYQENLELISGLEYSFSGAGERVGTYTITVTKEGYQTYTSAPIIVTRDVCHVIPQSLTVHLHPN